MIQRSGEFSNFLSGQLRLGVIGPSLQAATAPATRGTSSPSLPLELKADPRALPPASVLLALIPLLVLLALALRRESRFRDWCRISVADFLGLFSPILRRRHVIHDKPYLNQVLQAELGGRHPRSGSLQSSSRRSYAEPPSKDAILPSAPDAGRDLPS